MCANRRDIVLVIFIWNNDTTISREVSATRPMVMIILIVLRVPMVPVVLMRVPRVLMVLMVPRVEVVVLMILELLAAMLIAVETLVKTE